MGSLNFATLSCVSYDFYFNPVFVKLSDVSFQKLNQETNKYNNK